MKASVVFFITTLFSVSSAVYADKNNFDQCLLNTINKADRKTTVAEIYQACQKDELIEEDIQKNIDTEGSLLSRRITQEILINKKRNTITPHKRNYFMPFTYIEEPNEEPFRNFNSVDPEDELDNEEAKFQLSIKTPLLNNLLLENDSLYIAFTITSFWQAYNDEISGPFRETNYEPEIYWATPLSINPFNTDGNLFTVGFSHQSNGRNLPLSRSWNRIYINTIWEKDNWVFSFKPWWRIPEDDKDDLQDPGGDDNPDIDDFLGHFEFNTILRQSRHEFGLMLRNNLRSDNRGAVELNWSFPLSGKLRGYVQYFNGYGESLIDYNASIERVGVGILLTDLL